MAFEILSFYKHVTLISGWVHYNQATEANLKSLIILLTTAKSNNGQDEEIKNNHLNLS